MASTNSVICIVFIFVSVVHSTHFEKPGTEYKSEVLLNKIKELKTKGAQFKNTINNFVEELKGIKERSVKISNTKKINIHKSLESLAKSTTEKERDLILQKSTRSFSTCNVQDLFSELTNLIEVSINASVIISLEVSSVFFGVVNCTQMSPFKALSCFIAEISKVEELIPDIIEEVENYVDEVQMQIQVIVDDIMSCFNA